MYSYHDSISLLSSFKIGLSSFLFKMRLLMHALISHPLVQQHSLDQVVVSLITTYAHLSYFMLSLAREERGEEKGKREREETD